MKFLKIFFILPAPFLEKFFHALVIFRIYVRECFIFEFALKLSHTEAVGEGSVDLKSFKRDPSLLIFFFVPIQRLYIVQAVSKLDNEHTHILCGRNEHFTETFNVAFHALVFEFTELGNALYKK